MNKEEFSQKIERIIGDGIEVVMKNIIMEQDDGVEAFNRYQIQRTKINTFAVKKSHVMIDEFSSARSALSWCVADKFQRLSLAQEIKNLDQEKQRLSNDIDVAKAMLNTYRDAVLREIAREKINHKHRLLMGVNSRLTKCTNVAKYLQIRGFNDEIARTRRPAPNTTNRPRHRKSSRSAH